MEQFSQKILVTGSEGLIGDAIVQRLSSEYRVAGLDIARPRKDPAKLDFINCDFTQDSSVRAALDELEQREGTHFLSVVHLVGYYDFSGDPSPLYRDLTIEGTRRCSANFSASTSSSSSSRAHTFS